MAENYERTAQNLHTNSIDAASFEVVYYSLKGSGTPCSCRSVVSQDPLNSAGEMDASTMTALLEGADPDLVRVDSSQRRFRLEGYAEETAAPSLDEPMVEGLTEDLDYNEDEDQEASFDNASDANDVLNGLGSVLAPVDQSVANCAVCNKTGFVGGFIRYGGARMVWAVPDWVSATITNIMPNPNARPAYFEVGDGTGTVEWTAILPKNPTMIATIRLMDNYTPLQMGTDFELSVNGEVVSNLNALHEYCTGQLVTLKLESAYNFTHFELEFQLQEEPFNIDISNWGKVANQQSLNDFSSLQINIPPKIPFVQRGDILFEKSSRVGWVIADPEVIRSAIMVHGYSATINRINARYDAYAIQNPYTASSAHGSIHRPKDEAAPRSSKPWFKPESPEPSPPDTVPDWGEW